MDADAPDGGETGKESSLRMHRGTDGPFDEALLRHLVLPRRFSIRMQEHCKDGSEHALRRVIRASHRMHGLEKIQCGDGDGETKRRTRETHYEHARQRSRGEPLPRADQPCSLCR